MLEAYKQRRAAKHAAQNAVKVDNSLPVFTPSMESIVAREAATRIPRLSWVNAKARPSSMDTRKNTSWHSEEWNKAIAENGSRTFESEVDKALIENLEEKNLQGSGL
jgi:hypothetical protein